MENLTRSADTVEPREGSCCLETRAGSLATVVDEPSSWRQEEEDAPRWKIETVRCELASGVFLSVKDQASGILLHLEWLRETAPADIVRVCSSVLERYYGSPKMIRCDNTICAGTKEQRHVEGA